MRKVIAPLLVVSLFGIVPAQAAVNAGVKCKKAGTTTTVLGKKFTCIKMGSKLVWNKGVMIKSTPGIKLNVCPAKAAEDKSQGITQVRADTFITMTEADAEMCAMALGWIYRLGQRDAKIFAGTFDYQINRVTVTVLKGFVTQVNVG